MKSSNVVCQRVQLVPFSLFCPRPAKLLCQPLANEQRYCLMPLPSPIHPPSVTVPPGWGHMDDWSPERRTQVRREKTRRVTSRSHIIHSHARWLCLEFGRLKRHRTMAITQLTNTAGHSRIQGLSGAHGALALTSRSSSPLLFDTGPPSLVHLWPHVRQSAALSQTDEAHDSARSLGPCEAAASFCASCLYLILSCSFLLVPPSPHFPSVGSLFVCCGDWIWVSGSCSRPFLPPLLSRFAPAFLSHESSSKMPARWSGSLHWTMSY